MWQVGCDMARIAVVTGAAGGLGRAISAKLISDGLFVVGLDSYAYLVPYVEESEYYFLKTVIPSRKATKNYLE